MTLEMTLARATKLKALVRAHYALDGLPDTITVPALGTCREPAAKAVEEATLDDLAFALNSIEDEFNAVGDRLHAVRMLYVLARRAGGRGADVAVAVASSAGALTPHH